MGLLYLLPLFIKLRILADSPHIEVENIHLLSVRHRYKRGPHCRPYTSVKVPRVVLNILRVTFS